MIVKCTEYGDRGEYKEHGGGAHVEGFLEEVIIKDNLYMDVPL